MSIRLEESEMTIAHVNGVDLYYEVHGSGETVFLTHGSWGDATSWQAVVSALADRFEVVIWDRRGHSRSSDGDGAGSLKDDADDLAALIEHLDRRGAHVYGSSSGGTVVLKLLVANPDLVASAAVHEPAVPGLLDDVRDEDTTRALEELNLHLGEVRALIQSGDNQSAAQYFIDNVAVGPGAWRQFPKEVRQTFIANAPTYPGELDDPEGLIVDTDTLAISNVPIMITLGTESPPLLLSVTNELIRRLPLARAQTLGGSGHVPYRTHPDLWLTTLIGFYDTLQKDQTAAT